MKRAVIIALIAGLVVIYFKTNTTNKQSNVTANVELLNEESNEQELVFNVIIDTHSVDLNAFDLQNNIILEKNGKKIKPKKINVSGSIHHKTAEIAFNSTPTPFTVFITNLDNVPKREFTFTKLN